MRPLKLVMSAFGSYAGEETVDFSGMENGIFLVTGDTGSGKTTIFDGIVYALYDRTSGGVRDGNMMRSSYADLRTPTFVEFSFSCRGEDYRIVRNPDYERESLRKDKDGNPKKTQEKSKVELYLPDGSLFRGNKREVNRKIQELLGLDAEQFMQVAMIAQGDFLRLLHAKSEERKEIFSRIFDTGIYGKIQKELRELEKDSYGRLKDKEKAIREQGMRILAPEDWEGWESLEKAREQGNPEELLRLLELLIKELGRQVTLLQTEKEQKKQQASRMEKIWDTARTIVSLQEKIQKQEKWLEENLLLEAQYQEEERKGTQKLQEKTEKLQMHKIAAEKEQQRFAEEEKALKERLSQMEGLKSLWSEAILAMKKQKKTAADWDKANRSYKEKQQAYEKMYDLFLREQAGILADSLMDGMPCPVCGSTVHPRKALLSSEAPSQAQVENGKKTCKKAEEEREQAQKSYEEAARDYQTALGSLTQEGKRLLGENFDAKADEWKQKASNAMEKAKTELKECREEYNRKKAERKAEQTILEQEAESVRKMAESARKKLEAFIRQASQTKGEKKAAMEQKTELLKKWKQESGKNDFFQIGPDGEEIGKAVETTEEELAVLNVECRDLEKEYQKVYSMYQSDEMTAELLKKYQKEHNTLQKEYVTLHHLSQTACGNLSGTAKIDFESYIQRQYFEKIIHRANKRLMQMSSGQFILKCRRLSQLGNQGRVGLDLDIYSLVTESIRDVKTLSGGESFMAALSMALGLADVIQDSTGAVRLDTLFIDEGFGSLDDNAREQAIRVLYDLAGENRLIGIISHVTELKEQIEPKLFVTKTKKGSHVAWSKV